MTRKAVLYDANHSPAGRVIPPRCNSALDSGLQVRVVFDMHFASFSEPLNSFSTGLIFFDSCDIDLHFCKVSASVLL